LQQCLIFQGEKLKNINNRKVSAFLNKNSRLSSYRGFLHHWTSNPLFTLARFCFSVLAFEEKYD